MVRACVLSPLLALTLSACAAAPPRPSPEALRASLEKAELAFAAAVAERGVDAWVETFAEEGVMMGATPRVIRGRAAIRAAMGPFLAKAKITWHPTVVEVSPSGDMGFTFGPSETTEGGKVVARGTFFSVWRRGADGVWRVIADHGSTERPSP